LTFDYRRSTLPERSLPHLDRRPIHFAADGPSTSESTADQHFHCTAIRISVTRRVASQSTSPPGRLRSVRLSIRNLIEFHRHSLDLSKHD
jgi:hypothetical protein